tara:strand:- start:4361 stop:4849 length:489 start_codon:yes stop_codon:yes gene_type:complete
MNYKKKYLKYKLKYLNLKKMYGGMNFNLLQINNNLLLAVNLEIFSNSYGEYLDTMSQKNFLEYQDDFKTTQSLNTLEYFENNITLNELQSRLEHSLGIEKLNQHKQEIIKQKRCFDDMTIRELHKANLPASEVMDTMDGEGQDDENGEGQDDENLVPRNPDN